MEASMTKISRFLTIAGLAGALLTGTAFAQSTSTGAMSSSDHMSSGHMTAKKHDSMSAGAMGSHMSDHMASADHMKTKHSKMMSKHGKKKSHHMTSGAMTSGH
jgi:hypothetical protein